MKVNVIAAPLLHGIKDFASFHQAPTSTVHMYQVALHEDCHNATFDYVTMNSLGFFKVSKSGTSMSHLTPCQVVAHRVDRPLYLTHVLLYCQHQSPTDHISQLHCIKNFSNLHQASTLTEHIQYFQ